MVSVSTGRRWLDEKAAAPSSRGRWRSATTSTAIIYRPRCEGNSPCLTKLPWSTRDRQNSPSRHRFPKVSAGVLRCVLSQSHAHARMCQNSQARFRRPAGRPPAACSPSRRLVPVHCQELSAQHAAAAVSGTLCYCHAPDHAWMHAQFCWMIANNCGSSLTQRRRMCSAVRVLINHQW